MVDRVGMPLEAFLKLPDSAEFIDGEVILMSPAKIKYAYQPHRPEIGRGRQAETFSGGDVIPGFEMKAADLFA